MKKLLILSMLFLLALVGSAAAALSGPGVGTTVSLGTAAVDATTSVPLDKSSAFTLSNDAAAVSTITYGLKAAASGTAFPSGTVLTGTTPTSIAAGTSSVPATASVAVKVTFPVNTPVGTYTGVMTASDGTTTFDLVTVTATVSNTHNVVNDPTGALTVDVDYSTLRDRDTKLNTTKSVTIKNTGVFSEQVTLSFAVAKTDFSGSLSTADSSFTLAAGASKTVTLNLGVSLIATGSTKLGALDIKFGNPQTTTSVDVNANVKTMLDLADIDVQVGEEDDKNLQNGDNIDAEAKPEDKVVFTFKVENLFDKDYNFGDFEDVEINLNIDDRDFGDDIDEDSKEFDLDAGEDKDDVEISFNVPDDADEGDYEVEITLSGILKETGARHSVVAKLTLEVNLQDDDVRINSIEPNPLTLQCSRDATISVLVKNQGSNDQDDVVINVDSSSLGISERFTGIELDELSGSNDDARKEFRVHLAENFAAGTYEYEVRAFIEGDKLMDSERGTIRVEDCARRTTTGTTTTGSDINGGTTVVVQPPVTTTPPPTTPTGAATADLDDEFVDSVEVSFTQSPYFLVLLVLANVVVLALIVFIIVKVAVK